MRRARTTVSTALLAMGAEGPTAEGYSSTEPAIDEQSRIELIRVLKETYSDLDLII